ncbi:hypothetical protein N431DRAFT_459245 [Stipitochalara longipes BDJ]|nr:hypothetical protein N431DRAFT_459245 [Stipitochalara longipes BDJ]
MVIGRFLYGKFTVNDETLDGNTYSTLQATESAFLRKGVRIDPAHAISASRDAKEHGLGHGGVALDHQVEVSKGSSISPDSTKLKSQPLAKAEGLSRHQNIESGLLASAMMRSINDKGINKRKREPELLSKATNHGLPSSKRSKVEDKVVGGNTIPDQS